MIVNPAHDLFLLLITLSQMRDEESILRVFEEAVGRIWESLTFRRVMNGDEDGGNPIPISSRRPEFGAIVVSGDWERLSVEDRALIQNAVALLGLILEKKTEERLLEDRRAMLEEAVSERTGELELEIHERKAAEEALRQSERRFRAMVERAPLGIVIVDATFSLEYVNPRFVEMFGYAMRDIPDYQSWLRLAYPDSGYRLETERLWMDFIKRARAAQGVETILERRVRCKDGSHKEIEFRYIALDAKGLIIMTDVTERKNAVDLMIQNAKMLSIGGLAAGMAHEINNPLGIIMASIQNMRRRLSPDFSRNQDAAKKMGVDLGQVARYVEERGVSRFAASIEEAAERAGNIVRNMLDFSRRSESRRAAHSINALLDKVVSLAASDYDLKKRYDFKRIHIVKEYDSALPEVSITETEIEQVCLNIFKNAAQAMAEKNYEQGEKLRIELRTRREDDFAVIEIADNGPGIDENVRRRLFEPFFTTKPPGLGTGLGLSVSYFIVTQNHGGEIEVDATPGKGAVFTIRLPLCPLPLQALA